MSADIGLERRLARWFADEAPAHAPDRVLAVAMDRVGLTPQRRGLGMGISRRWSGLSSTRRIALVLASLLLAALAVAVVGALATRIQPGGGPPSLILVRSDDGTDQAAAITIVERDADGTERVLARFTDEQLGGPAQLWLGAAVVSPFDHLVVPVGRPDGTYGYVIADLRDPSAPVQQLDINGSYATFAPDGVLGISTPEGLAVHDPFTGTSTSTGLAPVDGNPPYPPLALDQLLSWTADSTGVLADNGMYIAAPDDTVRAGALGTLHRGGDFVPGTVPLAYDGVNARRTDPAGTLLRCAGGYDTCFDLLEWDVYAVTAETQRVVYDNPTQDRRISDFAWAIDGGLWLLLESAAPGPRDVALVRVAPDGTETTVADFMGPADDPDESSYFQSASFDGMAPDDSSIVVRVSGEEGAPGAIWLVDTTTGQRSQLAGAVAGWRTPNAPDRERPAVTAAAPTDPTLRDVWSTPERTIQLGATSLILDPSGTPSRLTVAAAGIDTIAITGAGGDLGCGLEDVGTYRWAIASDTLELRVVDDPCTARSTTLDGVHDRSLPIDQNGPPRVPGGHAYRAGAFGLPFLLTVPDGTDVEVWRHDRTTVALTSSGPGDTFRSLVVQAPTDAAADPCERFSTPRSLPPGATGVLGYLQDAGLATTGPDVVDVDGHAATVVDVTAPADCGERGLSLFADAGGSALGIGSDARLLVFELDDGTPIVVTVRTEVDDIDGDAWTTAVIESLRFP